MKEPEPKIELIKDDNLSVDELVELKDAGYSVMRSAHVGNLSPYNIALAQAGIPIISVDHTITDVDTAYIPEQIIRSDVSARIAPMSRLTCRTLADCGAIPPDIPLADGARYLDEVHLSATRAILQGATLFTNTEYQRDNEPVVGELAAITLKTMPQAFVRLALPDGTTQKNDNATSLVDSLGIMQLNDDPRAEKPAVIMPNVLNILANFVVEALTTGRDEQFHLSGRAMVRYIDGLMPDLQKLYGEVKSSASFGEQLPDILTVRLVPAAESKYATTMARRPQLDNLLVAYETAQAEKAILAADKKAFFTGEASTNEAKKAFTNQSRQRQAAIEQPVGAAMQAIPEVFAEAGQPGFLTQYDVQKEGGLYVPKVNRQATMAELAMMSKDLNEVKKHLKIAD